MRIFVTGASGFVGGAVVRQLLDKHEILAMARSDSSANAVATLGAQPVRCALGAVEVLHLIDVDAIVHCAAFVEPWGTRDQFWQTNVTGTTQLLAIAKQAGVKRFIHIGTEAALFDGHDLHNIDENTPYADNTPFLYPETKREAEKAVLKANDPAKGFTTVSLRPRLIWGPGDQTIVPEIEAMAAKGMYTWIDHGRATTSTAYIGNVAHAVELALNHGEGGRAYFITDGVQISFKEFLTRLMQTQGISLPERSLPGWLARGLATFIEGCWTFFHLSGAPPMVRFSITLLSRECTIKSDLAEKDLGYTPLFSLDEGLREMETKANDS